MKARDYQIAAIDAVFDYWAGGGANPLVEMATGTGKSVVVAGVTRRVVENWQDMRVLNLVHVRELVEQNYMALVRQWPSAPAGVNAASLGRRDTRSRILYGAIQSVYRKAREIGPFDLVMIDECHLIPPDGAGMYRRLLDDLREMTPDLRLVGFTATPFRLRHGRLDQGDDRIFSDTVFEYGIGRAIDEGWLAPLVSKPGDAAAKINTGRVGMVAGEFNAKALERAANTPELVKAAVADICEKGRDRRSWLIFCSGVEHARYTAEALRLVGVSAETVTGDTPPAERSRLVADFRAGRIRALTNANVLTTGFDAPGVDLIAALRPTMSASLYVQMMGRGTRPVWPQGFDPNEATADVRRQVIASGVKSECLVLDYAGNVRRHGPVDMLTIKEPGKGGGEAPVKECPKCSSLIHTSKRVCPDCGHEFPEPERIKHAVKADTETPILARAAPKLTVQEIPVTRWEARRHQKEGRPDSVCVTYWAALRTFREWVCLEHTGPVRFKAERWWGQHCETDDLGPPRTVSEALERWSELRAPAVIQVRKDGQWDEIMGRKFAPPSSSGLHHEHSHPAAHQVAG